MRVLICGDRHWTDKDAIRNVLASLEGVTHVIEGEARGADTLARVVAEELGITVLPFPANWTKYGRAAGPIRNRQMLDEGKPDLVIGFHNNLTESRGTKNMLEQARKARIQTRLCTSSSSSAGISLRDKQYEPPNYETKSWGSGRVEGSPLGGFRVKSVDGANFLKEIPNYKDIMVPKPNRVFVLEEAYRVTDTVNFQPLFKVVGTYGRGMLDQLFIVGRDRHTREPFALGIPNGFVNMPIEACLRWTLDAHKGDELIEI